MKERELRKHANCSLCGNKIMASGVPLFWRVTFEQFGVDAKAVMRQTGLTMMLGGNAVIAQAMGPDEEMAVPVMEPVTITVCATCSTGDSRCVAALAERGRE